jgi:uncharacterized protein YwqG
MKHKVLSADFVGINTDAFFKRFYDCVHHLFRLSRSQMKSIFKIGTKSRHFGLFYEFFRKIEKRENKYYRILYFLSKDLTPKITLVSGAVDCSIQDTSKEMSQGVILCHGRSGDIMDFFASHMMV